MNKRSAAAAPLDNIPSKAAVPEPGADAGLRPALELVDVWHRYGDTPAVCGMNLSVAQGEVVCLLGPSGCGKTTALRIAAGLEQAEKGRVLLDGTLVSGDGRRLPPEQRNVGLVFQDYALFPHLTIFENVAFGLVGRTSDGKKDRVEQVLQQVGMPGAGNRYPHELSGGQQQRVALARALAPEPTLILLDEPFSGLDARLRDRVRDQTLHALQSAGAATLMVTHDAEEAMYMADRVAVMHEGTVVQDGEPDTLYRAPASSFVAGFFGEVNRIPASVRNGQVRSALGRVSAPDLADGTLVELVVRPEAIVLGPAPANASGPGVAVVEAARMLGRTSLIHLFAQTEEGEEVHVHARAPGRYLPAENTVLTIKLDPSQAFVFPVGDAK